jgi:hypothetical protein
MGFLKLSQDYGIVGIFVMLTLFVLLKIGEFLWQLRQKKETATDAAILNLTVAVKENTDSHKQLQCEVKRLETMISELPKFKTDVRRFYAAIKFVAGERWPEIRDEILKDEFTL